MYGRRSVATLTRRFNAAWPVPFFVLVASAPIEHFNSNVMFKEQVGVAARVQPSLTRRDTRREAIAEREQFPHRRVGHLSSSQPRVIDGFVSRTSYTANLYYLHLS